MLNLKRSFELKAIATVAALWCAAAPAHAAIIDRTVGTAPASISWDLEPSSKSQTGMALVSTDGETYQIALEFDGLASVSFSNALFLSESLDTTDMNREMTLADNSKRHQKLLFTQVRNTQSEALRNENLRILPMQVERYLKSMKSQWKGILGDRNDSSAKQNYRAIKNAISLDGATQHINNNDFKNRIIVSREYGGVRTESTSKMFGGDSFLVSLIGMVFSQGAVFAIIGGILILSFLSRAIGRSRHA
ncbi:MAG: hypothetical protein JKY20_07445 [Alphaproteobacteria bacterium]|nr:hypothetical protein [Alphaproteobacteria bacterium]